MRNLFHEYFPLEKNAINAIWSTANIILDTNILLRLYRYKNETTQEVLDVLNKLGDRVWIPYHVAWEYNERRLAKITESEKVLQEILGLFQNCVDKVQVKLEEQKNFGIHPLINVEAKIGELAQAIKEKHDQLITEHKSSNSAKHYAALHVKIGDLFNNKVGPAYNNDELHKIYEEGSDRYEKMIPPGFKDANKSNGDKSIYGDLIIWKQIIQFSKKANKPVIFVTEDTKDDWWQSEQGKTIGPAPALRKEFLAETGQEIHFYRLEKFLEWSAEKLNAKVSKASVAEVNEDAKNRQKAIALANAHLRAEIENAKQVIAANITPSILEAAKSIPSNNESSSYRKNLFDAALPDRAVASLAEAFNWHRSLITPFSDVAGTLSNQLFPLKTIGEISSLPHMTSTVATPSIDVVKPSFIPFPNFADAAAFGLEAKPSIIGKENTNFDTSSENKKE